MSDAPEWFAPKRYGYGAGLPIAWQGWAVLVGFVLLTGGLVVIFGRHTLRFFAVLAPLMIVFLLITARTTRGGWRWRWGDED